MVITINRIGAYARILLTSFVLASFVLPQFNPNDISSKIYAEIADSEWSFEPPETDAADGSAARNASQHWANNDPASTKIIFLDRRSEIGFLSSRSPTGPPIFPL